MSTVKLKRSGVAGKIPTIAQVDLGELAINTYDGKLYLKKDVDGTESIVEIFGNQVGGDSIVVDAFTGDGSSNTFFLSTYPDADQYAFVTINGVEQHVTEYDVASNQIQFSEAPANNDIIEVRTFKRVVSGIDLRNYKSYIYTVSGVTSVSGVDDYGFTLTYESNKVEVYLNGVRLVPFSDYTTSGGTTINFLETVTGIVEVVSLSTATLLNTPSDTINGNSATLTTNSANQVVDSFGATEFRTAKYVVQMTEGTDYHVTEVMILHDGTDVYISEYGTIFTNASLGTFSGDILNGQVRLLVSPVGSSTVVKTKRISLTV